MLFFGGCDSNIFYTLGGNNGCDSNIVLTPLYFLSNQGVALTSLTSWLKLLRKYFTFMIVTNCLLLK